MPSIVKLNYWLFFSIFIMLMIEFESSVQSRLLPLRVSVEKRLKRPTKVGAGDSTQSCIRSYSALLSGTRYRIFTSVHPKCTVYILAAPPQWMGKRPLRLPQTKTSVYHISYTAYNKVASAL